MATARSRYFKIKPSIVRTFTFGYRSNEIPKLCYELPLTDNSQLLRYTQSDINIRQVANISLGPHYKNAACPHPDQGDSQTVVDGIKKRLAVQMPTMLPGYRRKFRRFVSKWIADNLKPLDATYDFSVEKWLEQTNYPLYRKNELLLKAKKLLNPNDPKHLKCKSFIKDETYTDYKHARTINSRTDEFKIQVGPYIKAVEKQVLAGPNFIKYVPKARRPRALLDRFYGKYKYYLSTDFSSFEAHFTELLEDTEFLLYEYMFQYIPDGKKIYDLLAKAMLEINTCVFKYATIEIWRRRMSGEMSTSLGNGFANLMLILFIASLLNQKVDPYCEGDDGVFGMNCLPPTKEWLYKNLGLDLKIQVLDCITRASFCGCVFNSTDCLIVTDPIDGLVYFGWTTAKYARSKNKRLMELLRSKSLSLLYEYPGCPILAELGRYGIRITEGFRARGSYVNEFERERHSIMVAELKLTGLPTVAIPAGTRNLVSELYGVSVQHQLEVEFDLKNKNDLLPLSFRQLDDLVPQVYRHYYENYARIYPANFKLEKMMCPEIFVTRNKCVF
jgi:hypothetical protein